ncbi:MAG: type I 3-dehydroquinate dehydratase [Rhabdochlamydiaceae bacterium]|nr:type I 3-dehydroquinate dehydratase [Candidatus Amphrikana amoebophyrae]
MALFLSLKDLQKTIPNQQVDGIELRIEYFDDSQLVAIKSWIEKPSSQIIIAWKLPFDQEAIEKILDLSPSYIDVDYNCTFNYDELMRKYSHVKWIVSHHDFEKTPSCLISKYQEMRSRWPLATYIKIAAMANSTVDSLRMIELSQNSCDVIAICMGELGKITRLLAPVFNMPISYTCLKGEEVAAGQINVEELHETYFYDKINSETQLFGLIGNPVSFSPSHITHNRYFRSSNWNALYVKMEFTTEEIEEALSRLDKIGFLGLSVTMPHKKEVRKYLETKEDVVNTIRFGKIREGINTDGIGAASLVEELIDLKGAKVLVLGAGSTAESIAKAFLKKGANVSIWNRSLDRLNSLVNKLGCNQYSQGEFDVVVQSTSVGFGDSENSSIDFSQFISKKSVAFEVVSSKRDTPFIIQAKLKGCHLIYGMELFERQAQLQFHFWKQIN